MSQIYPGGFISKTAPTTTGANAVDGDGGSASGIWTVDQVATLSNAGLWPKQAQFGYLYSFGGNNYGEVGDNTRTSRSSPVQIGSDSSWYRMSGGGVGNMMALKSDRTLWLWGYNYVGQLGINNRSYRSSPTQLGSDSNWNYFGVGSDNAIATKTTGTLWNWGGNTNGQLGQNTVYGYRSSPVQVGALTSWNRVAAGGGAHYSIKTDGTLWAWGKNSNGQLGTNDTVRRSSPIQVGADTNWSMVASLLYCVAAVKTDNTLWTWGNGLFGFIGNNTGNSSFSSPSKVGSDTNWSMCSVSQYGCLALKTNGTLWFWGRSDYGQSGIGNVVSNSSPVQVGALTNWSRVSSGRRQSYAIKNDGTLWAWGRNNAGQLGDGTTIHKSSPIQVGAGTKWHLVAGGRYHVSAIEKP